MATWGSWNTSSSVSAATITDTSNTTSEAISNSGYKSTEIAIVATYGTTATEGLEVYVLRQEGSTAYQSISDKPFSPGRLDYAVSSTRKMVFTVPSDMVSQFKIALQNNSGDSVSSVTLYYRQST